ncbi:TIGR00730 family Rossman fold protein [Terrarubrum flagellatum]|uniref:LOG family protein n=1 Tax=Terrirubrum flagellatum TaxID=2895980 RepID=UPI0031452CFC
MPDLIRSVCVYCGSSPGHDPSYAQAARELGRILAEEGVKLVYGGGGSGVMGEIARATLAHGGHVLGIIPSFLREREVQLNECTELVVVPDMHVRKQRMFDEADAFVALPGGVGTLEELAEQMTWAQIGRHTKPILIADVSGFWRPLLSLFAHMREAGFIRAENEVKPIVAEKIIDVLPMLRAAAQRTAAAGTPNSEIVTRF